MNERFSELLAKGQTGRLTEAETEELVRGLNAPILAPLQNPTSGFVSKLTFAPSDVAGRLRGMNWFSGCGKPLALGLTMPIEQVGSWPEAVDCCKDGVWENVQLKARNQLTLWLHENDHENYRNWNAL